MEENVTIHVSDKYSKSIPLARESGSLLSDKAQTSWQTEKKKKKKKSMSFLEDVGGQTSVSCGQNPRGFSVRNVTTLRGLSWQALTTTMFRVFSTVMRKSPRQVAWRGVSSETSNVVKWEKEKLQMQLQHTKATRAG